MAGRSAVVTGAGQGIGLAIAQALVANDWYVIGVDRNEAEANRLAESLGSDGGVVVGDVTTQDVLVEAVRVANEDGHRISAWVNNAGIALPSALHEMVQDNLRSVLAVNLEAAVAGSRLAVEAFRQHGQGGSIVTISSIHGRLGMRSHLAYDVSKGALDAMTRNIAVQYGLEGIRANSVAPGPIWTPQMEQSLRRQDDPEGAASRLGRATALGRIGRPEEIGSVVEFLVGPGASYITGQTIYVDGGWSSQGLAQEE